MRKLVALLLAIALSLLMGCGVANDNIATSSTTSRAQTTAVTKTKPPTPTQSSRGGGCASTGDIQKCTTTIPQAAQGARPPRVETPNTNGYGYTVAEYIDWVVESANTMWTRWFYANGFQQPYVWIRMVFPEDQPIQSKCLDPDTQKEAVVTASTSNAFYCPLDVIVSNNTRYQGSLIIPITSLQKAWTGDIFGKQSQNPGDFAAAMIIAHEFGHHVQDELSIQSQHPRPSGKYAELIADCFAGNWAASQYAKGTLEKGDMLEAVGALKVSGDPYVATNSHGTADERIAAMMVGYGGSQGQNPGDPRECFARYWH